VKLLHGSSVYLTAPILDDLTALQPLMQSMDYQRWASTSSAYLRQTPQKLLDSFREQRQNGSAYPFVIRMQADERPIGICMLLGVNWHSRHALAAIGIVGPAYRGQGLGSDAMRVLLRYGFDIVNLNRIGLKVASFNKMAIASYEKLGFVVEVTQREAVYRDGEYHDILLMGILRDEWSKAEA